MVLKKKQPSSTKNLLKKKTEEKITLSEKVEATSVAKVIPPQKNFYEKLKENTIVSFIFIALCVLLIGFGLGDIIGTAVTYWNNQTTQAGAANTPEVLDDLVEQQAPDFTVTDTAGTSYTLSTLLSEKSVLVSLEATSCSWCAKQAPELEKVWQKYQDKLVVLTIFSGEEKEAVNAYIAEKGVSHPVGIDAEKAVFGQYGLQGTPKLIFIDKSGKVKAVSNGYAQYDKLESLLKTIL